MKKTKVEFQQEWRDCADCKPTVLAIVFFGNFQFWQLQFWQLSILTLFDFGNLAIFIFHNSGTFGNFQFCQLSIVATSNFDNFQFWQLSILKLSVLTIFNLGYFQAKFSNVSQEQPKIVNKLTLSTPQDLYHLIMFCFIWAIRWRQRTRGRASTSRHTQLLSL